MTRSNSPAFRNIALVGKYQASNAVQNTAASRAALEELAHFLMDFGSDVHIEADTAAHLDMPLHSQLDVDGIGHRCDLCIVIGGDGTMLGMGRQMAPFNIPLIGINQGRLGFITDIAIDQMKTTLQPMLTGQYIEDRRSLMEAKVVRSATTVFSALALNDVVVNRGATTGMVEMRIEVDGRFVARQRADGLIIATPTGSTAYALSSGGPMMHPSTPAWVMVPIAPHTLSNRPLVLNDGCEISIELVSGRDASANFDMQQLAAIMHGDRIVVKRSQHQACFLHPLGWTYFDTLRQKLHWNEGVI